MTAVLTYSLVVKPYPSDNTMHVCENIEEAAVLMICHLADQPCPRCIGTLIWIQHKLNNQALLGAARKWLANPQHDALRARGDKVYRAVEYWEARFAKHQKALDEIMASA